MSSPRPRLHWGNTSFMVAIHSLAAVAAWWLVSRFHWQTLALGLIWYGCCGISITAGYHRLFAHAAYKGNPVLRFFYLLFGAASFQQSALQWSAEHRAHHAYTDEEQDPYNIQKGFWWAHIGWVLFRAPNPDYHRVRDLSADPLVRFQHRFYIPTAVGIGFALPAWIGAAWNDATGAFLAAGCLRLVLEYHATFCVNSVAHVLGARPYRRDVSARDSFITALLTFGEGYHNFHHRFPSDYRNGVRFHQYDPTKWWLKTLSWLGLALDLKRVSPQAIAHARLDAALAVQDEPFSSEITVSTSPPSTR